MMALFVVVAILMVVIVLALLLPVLWRGQRKEVTDRRSQNIAIYKEQLAQLEESQASGEVTAEQYTQTRNELEASLLQDIESEDTPSGSTNIQQNHGRRIALVLGVALPLFVIAGYLLMGTPAIFDKSQRQAQQSSSLAQTHKNMPSVDEMLSRLEQKLVEDPNNLKGWMMAGRSYMVLKRYPDAVRALKHAYALDKHNAEIVFRYADALAMSQGGRFNGEAFNLLKAGLSLEPENVMGLWLAGNASAEQAKYAEAIQYWRRARQQLQAEPDSMRELDNLIANAQQQLPAATRTVSDRPETKPVIRTAPAVSTNGISIRVTLAKALREKVSPQDSVFIYAKAAQGPPMPLAVVRKQVKDLPLTVVLNDSMAMTPAMSLSRFERVILSARVSKSGSAMSAPGDLLGQTSAIAWRSAGNQNIEINQSIK